MPNKQLVGMTISFTTRQGIKVKGEVLRVVKCKDNKQYVVVKKGDKYIYKQKSSLN